MTPDFNTIRPPAGPPLLVAARIVRKATVAWYLASSAKVAALANAVLGRHTKKLSDKEIRRRENPSKRSVPRLAPPD
jgi:hypothetical protein